MSDHLIEQLRFLGDRAAYEPHMHHAAATAIEFQRDRADIAEAEAANLRARLADARSVLQSIARNTCCDGCQEAALDAREFIRLDIAEDDTP